MFGIFKNQSKVQVLKKRYIKLINESHKLSTIDRTKSDSKFAEAQLIMDELEKIQG